MSTPNLHKFDSVTYAEDTAARVNPGFTGNSIRCMDINEQRPLFPFITMISN
jgi:hypothetical protein